MTKQEEKTGGTIELGRFLSITTMMLEIGVIIKDSDIDFKDLLVNIHDITERLIIESGTDLSEEAKQGLRNKSKAVAEEASSLQGDFSLFGNYLFEVMISRFVDHFEFYICQILEKVLQKQPEALGKSQISVRDLLDCEDLAEAISSVIEKKVHDLSFKGLDAVFDFLNEQRGIPLRNDTPHYQAVLELLEVRNIIVHNGGNVSRRFLRKTQRTDLKPGDPFPLDVKYVGEAFRALTKLVEELDDTVSAHFGLLEKSAGICKN